MTKLLAALAAVALLAASCGEVVGPDRAQPLNHAPIVSVTGPSSSEPGETITIIATASDADGDALAFSWSSSETTDAIANPTAPSTAVTLGTVENTRTFRVQVSDQDISITASLAVVVSRDSVPPPPPPDGCVPVRVVVYEAGDPAIVELNQQWVTGYAAYGESSPEPVSVHGTWVGANRWNFDLTPLLGHPRFMAHAEVFNPDEPDSACWAILDQNTVFPVNSVFGPNQDPDGYHFRWVIDEPEPPCFMLPLGSSNWTDDGQTVTLEGDHANWSLYDAYGRESVPAVTIPGIPLGNGRWRFVVSVDDLQSHPRSNFHQRAIDWNASPSERAAMGCWADLLRTALPADAPFAVRSDPDGMSLEYVGSGNEPSPVDGFLFLDRRGVYYLSNFQNWSFYGSGPLETLASTSVIDGLYGFLIAAVDAAAASNPQSNLHTLPQHDAPGNTWAQLQGDEVWVAPRTNFEVAGDHLERAD